jgi:acetylglutamate kinase
MHFGPALNVVSGNYVAARRRGILEGVDYGFTGEVRYLQPASLPWNPIRRLMVIMQASKRSGF